MELAKSEKDKLAIRAMTKNNISSKNNVKIVDEDTYVQVST